jgi:hypothetical protein
MKRIGVALCAAGLLLAALDGAAFKVADRKPGGRLTLNVNMGTMPRVLIDGTFTNNEIYLDAMAAWNDVGIGPGLDHSFFSARNPLALGGDACERDFINEIGFATTNCGDAFGTTLAITRSWVRTSDSVVLEVDMIFDGNRNWDSYEGPLRVLPGTGQVQDLYRIALHELGHAAGLDHPDENGQTVTSIMNSHASSIDRLQPDDVAGARAIAWGTASTPPPSAGTPSASTIGTRATVAAGGTIYGAFTLVNTAEVMIAVRGPSLQTLGVTQDPLDAPRLRLYDAAGNDIVFDGAGARGVADCPAGNAVASHYANVRGTPLNARDACVGRTLSAGQYTFTIAGGLDPAGEALFEVLFNPQGSRSTPLESTGSRGMVTSTAAMFGGFTLQSTATVEIAVRGPSLQTLGVTQDPLDSPRLRIYDASGADVLFNTNGGVGVNACNSTHSVAVRYAGRGQPLANRDACAAPRLNAGTYTFNIVPGGSDASGEVLFEVTLKP